MKTNPDVRTVALGRALKMLDALGAQYKVFVDGAEYGTLKARPPKPERRSRSLAYPYGSVANHFRPTLEAMAVGDVSVIQAGEFDAQRLQNGIASWATTNWGKGSLITVQSADRRSIEMMRIA